MAGKQATVKRPVVEGARLAELEAEICAVAGSLRIGKAQLLELVGEFDAIDGWIATGAVSCAHWLAGLLDIELSTAREQVRVARVLRELPVTRGRVLDGSLSYAKARQLTRVATPESEVELLGVAERAPAGALARLLANWQAVRDPEGLVRRQWEDRSGSFRDEPDGSVTMILRGPAEVMGAVRVVVDTEVMRAHAPAGASLAQQRADAAVGVLTRPGGTDAPVRVELVLHRRAGQTDLDGLVLAPSVARRLGCDADLRVMTHRPDGSPADVGRRHRLVTPRLRRLVLECDRHCTHPGCTATEFLEIHHEIPWEHGGPTNLANLTTKCSFHHRYVHEHTVTTARRDQS